jgi:hypothetical protein
MNRFDNSVRGLVTHVETVGHSNTGNPTKRVTIEHVDAYGKPLGIQHSYLTASNTGLAYGIDNSDYRLRPHEYDLTKAGKLSGYVRELQATPIVGVTERQRFEDSQVPMLVQQAREILWSADHDGYLGRPSEVKRILRELINAIDPE